MRSNLGAPSGAVNGCPPGPVDAAGDVVGTGRCVAVDDVVHGLWMIVWTTKKSPLTWEDVLHPCGWEKYVGNGNLFGPPGLSGAGVRVRGAPLVVVEGPVEGLVEGKQPIDQVGRSVLRHQGDSR